MDFITVISMIVNVVVITALVFAVKNRAIVNAELAKAIKTLNPASEGRDSGSLEEIVTEIDAMRLQKQRLEAIVAATPFPMLLTDPAGKIVSANQAGMNLLEIDGRKPSDFYGETVSAFFYNDPGRPSVTDKVLKTRAQIRGIEASLKTRKNKTIYVLVDSGPIISPSGDLLGAFSIAVDITNQKTVEIQLKEKNDALAKMREEAEMMSSQLAASMEEFQNTMKEIQKQVIGNDEIANNVKGFMEKLKNSFRDFDATLTPVISGVETLSDDLRQIEAATANIKSISEQTDILALNARIEAERSSMSSSTGSNNEGFKIVAREVKDLAVKAKEITGEIVKINNHIGSVLSGSSSSLAVMKEKFDAITGELGSNSTSQDLAAVSSEIRNMLLQVDEAIREMGKTSSSLNVLIRES
jgi:methyl-accepting chemotaxis protein